MAILDFSDPPFAAPPFVPPSKPSDWTDLRISTLRKLWSEGLSAAQIAIKLWEITRHRFTRSAVIGKARRLKLEVRIPAGGRPRKPRRERLAKRRERWAIRKLTEPTYHTVEVLVELPAEDLSKAVTFAQLTDKTCRYPYSAQKGHHIERGCPTQKSSVCVHLDVGPAHRQNYDKREVGAKQKG